MNDNHCPTDFESLEPPLEAAVQAALAGSDSRRCGATGQNAGQAVGEPPFCPPCAGSSHHRGWKASRSIVAGLAAAAALMAMLIGGFVLLNHSGGRAFAQMLEKVKAISSVHFTTATRFGRGPETNGRMYLEGNRLRQEQFGGKLIMVATLTGSRHCSWTCLARLAQADKLDAVLVQGFDNPIDQLRHAKADDAEQIGEEILRGRRTRVYRLRQGGSVGHQGPRRDAGVDRRGERTSGEDRDSRFRPQGPDRISLRRVRLG